MPHYARSRVGVNALRLCLSPTPFPDQTLPLVKDAIEMEKKLVRDSLTTTAEHVEALTQQLGVTVDQVLGGPY